MGVWVLMLFTFDCARFGKPEDAEYHGRWNFGMPFYAVTFLLNGAAGIYWVSSIPHEDALTEVSVVMVIVQLMGLWGLLFVRATQTPINTANYCLTTLNLQAFFGRFGLRGSYLVWGVAVGVKRVMEAHCEFAEGVFSDCCRPGADKRKNPPKGGFFGCFKEFKSPL